MNDPNVIFRRQSKYMFYLLAIFVFGYAMPGFKPLFLGFIIGTIFAFFNLFLLIRRMHAFDRAVKKENLFVQWEVQPGGPTQFSQ